MAGLLASRIGGWPRCAGFVRDRMIPLNVRLLASTPHSLAVGVFGLHPGYFRRLVSDAVPQLVDTLEIVDWSEPRRQARRHFDLADSPEPDQLPR